MADEAALKFCAGNEAFVDEDYDSAIKFYSEAVQLNSKNADYYLKRCNAYIKLENYVEAVKDADTSIKLNPKNSKAHQRKGLALFHLKSFPSSLECYTTALQYDETNEQVKQWVRKCEAEIDLKKQTCTKNKLTIGLSKVHAPPPPPDAKKKEDSSCKSDAKDTPKSSSSSVVEKETATQADNIPMPVPKIKHDWYQTETHVIITVIVKNQNKDLVSCDFTAKTLSVSAKLPSGSDYSLELDLAHDIVPAQSLTRVLSTKIEIKLKKAEGVRWSALETDNLTTTVATTVATSTNESSSSSSSSENVVNNKYPSSAHLYKDWDRLAKEVQEEEKQESMEGEGALNKLFQQIYSDGNEETRRAMNKSFQESGGTVLSTNWGEVGKEKVDMKPPDCMEYKKYEY